MAETRKGKESTMPSKEFNKKTAQKPLNVFIVDGSSSMDGSPYSQGMQAALNLYNRSDVLVLTVSSKGVDLINKPAMATMKYGGAPDAAATKDILRHIQTKKVTGQNVNIVYFTDETPKGIITPSNDFLQELKKNSSAIHILTSRNKGAHEVFIVPSRSNKTRTSARHFEEEGFAYSMVSTTTTPSVISTLVGEIWNDQTASGNKKPASKVENALTGMKAEITRDLTEKTKLADQLKADIKEKKQLLAEQEADICRQIKERTKINAAVKAVKSTGKRHTGPSNK